MHLILHPKEKSKENQPKRNGHSPGPTHIHAYIHAYVHNIHTYVYEASRAACFPSRIAPHYFLGAIDFAFERHICDQLGIKSGYELHSVKHAWGLLKPSWGGLGTFEQFLEAAGKAVQLLHDREPTAS